MTKNDRSPAHPPLKPLALTFDGLVAELGRRYGKGRHHAAALYREVFRAGNLRLAGVPEFDASPKLAFGLAGDVSYAPGRVVAVRREDTLTKFVTRLSDGRTVESVVIPMATHATVCISSQVGCRMGCRFCETGRMGFHRDLTVEEMVGQVHAARFRIGADVRNVVFMGMGEPLDNFGNVMAAVAVLTEDRGFNLSFRRITLSTVGRIVDIRRLARRGEPRPLLAVSLNAPDDTVRSRIMPVNRANPMGDLRKALAGYPLRKGESLFIEYVLIRGVNDDRRHARDLAEYLRPLRVKLNLIPLNPGSEGRYRAPDEAGVERFLGWLREERVFVRRRRAKGGSVMAACGQLGGVGPAT